MNRAPALVAAARHGLVASSPPILLNSIDAQVVIHLARHDHLTGFLASAVTDGAVEVDEPTAIAIFASWHEELLACTILEALTVRTAKLLDSAEIEWRLTKGAAVAHLDYTDPSVRTFGDVDIIIHPAHWATAVELLSSHGYRRDAVPLAGDYDRRYGKGATFETNDGLEIDLHRRLAIGRFGVSSHMEDLFDGDESIMLAGRSIPVLTPETRLLHACYHASLGGFRRLRAFRDVAQLVIVSQVDWERTFAIARRWRAEAVVAAALVESWTVLDLEPGHLALKRAIAVHPSRSDKRSLQVFAEERPFRDQALTAVARLPLHEVPLYLWSLASHRRHRLTRVRSVDGDTSRR